ncbi:hypothetical protein G9F71_026120 [Clostridium sp. FP2]|uniref:hypothetical protein n=1 Tax=Clostridium sp. FP2 TaxID=2724481 RepID=UPI0013E91B9A|nr:hypothetical protein [Clostridium sp. FP2]MBZ9626285.1 hypothetical protein [Clostridium sp. FP2]
MKKIIKLKLPLLVISQILFVYTFYLSYYSNNRNHTTLNLVAILSTIVAAISCFLYGLEYIFIKKSKKLGYIHCIIAIIMPFPIVFLISKVSM